MLAVHNLTMEFPGVKALDAVNLSFQAGKVNALLGENGAGKSTLLKILSGVNQGYQGEIRLLDQVITFADTKASQAAGIAIIHQELNLFPNLSICENLFLGKELTNSWGLLDRAAMDRICVELLAEVGVNASPATLVGELKLSEQQLVEIAKALHSQASVILMDEPTSALSDQEIDRLHALIRRWQAEGKTIVYISHKMEELFRISEYFHVLRDGKSIAAGEMKDTNEEELIAFMVGRNVIIEPKVESFAREALAIEVKALRLGASDAKPRLHNIQFKAHQGEILGLYGLMGAGRTELLETLFGMHASEASMDIQIHGKPCSIQCPADAIGHQIAFVTEDRKKDGLVMDQDLAFNISLPSLHLGDWLQADKDNELAEKYRQDLRIKSASIEQLCGKLSGGNQQKVILAKWLATKPTILLLDEPTRGIDIQAKDEIYQLMKQIAAEGTCILFASSEIPEIVALADRVLVMCQGQIQAELTGSHLNASNLLKEALPIL